MPTIRLTWTDRNSGAAQEDEIRIYRDTASFDAGSLPSIFATLAADTVTYDDVTPVAGLSYYYAVAMEKDGILAIAFTGEVATVRPPANAVEYFLATNSTTQSMTVSSENELVVDVETFDTYLVLAANRFLVPAEIDGFYAILTASIVVSAQLNQTDYVAIQRSTDGGSSWVTIAATGNNQTDGASCSGYVQLATDDIYRAAVVVGASAKTINQDVATHFGGIILEPVA